VQEELKKSELIVSLSELESIRNDIISKFESTLNSTQQKIDMIIKELKIKPVSEISEPETEPKTTRRPKLETVEEEEEEEEDEEEKEKAGRRRTSNVDERLNRLKQEVLKELEELDRLELES
jgi:restriction endonuclease Mrr